MVGFVIKDEVSCLVLHHSHSNLDLNQGSFALGRHKGENSN